MSAVTRQYNEELSLPPLRLDVVDLRQLLNIMSDVFAEGDCSQYINVNEGRTETKYTSLADFETDTTLPDSVTHITISVHPKFGKSPELDQLFFSVPRAFATISGTDETLVLGQQRRLDKFFRKHRAAEPPIAKVFQSVWMPLAFFFLPANVVFYTLLLYFNRPITAISIGLALAAFGVYGYRVAKAPSLELLVRRPVLGARRFNFTLMEVLLLVATLLLIVITFLSWLYPRVPH